MMRKAFVLDCSVTMSWCFADEFDQHSEMIINSLTKYKALVPILWVFEVTNVLLIAEKHNRLKPADSIKFMDMLNSLEIHICDLLFPMHEIINVARSHHLSSYDANYLLLAMHKGVSIATKDKALINACLATGVSVFEEYN